VAAQSQVSNTGSVMDTPRSGGEYSRFELPHKPSDMDLATWSALLRRSQARCEMKCPSPCDVRLEVDHIHSRGMGGETSLANCRLICAAENRRRGMANDPKWDEHFYFDDYVSFNGLRTVQRDCGPETVRYYSDLFLGEARQRLLNTISLFALVCGAGKT